MCRSYFNGGNLDDDNDTRAQRLDSMTAKWGLRRWLRDDKRWGEVAEAECMNSQLGNRHYMHVTIWDDMMNNKVSDSIG